MIIITWKREQSLLRQQWYTCQQSLVVYDKNWSWSISDAIQIPTRNSKITTWIHDKMNTVRCGVSQNDRNQEVYDRQNSSFRPRHDQGAAPVDQDMPADKARY